MAEAPWLAVIPAARLQPRSTGHRGPPAPNKAPAKPDEGSGGGAPKPPAPPNKAAEVEAVLAALLANCMGLVKPEDGPDDEPDPSSFLSSFSRFRPNLILRLAPPPPILF
ncbi:hypothetical protein QAD02_012223 [Eretmocerus hayati]|uniref:Uncharacterized protein n=1 Tax=Eretmocerus hayati TaxID=131215 RepID=A0ACC2P0S4_9HYME|nr:hypothetical protein QAD02_012223 [Eretmocerus hayati]